MTTTDLISSIKLKGGFPTDNFFSTADYLSILNDQLKLDIIPLLLKLNEDYFITDKDYSITISGASYRLPKRAIGSKLRDVKLVDSSGNVTNLHRLFEEDRSKNLRGYYIRKNSIELSSDITSGTLRLTYFAAPNTLVAPTSCGKIISVDPVLNQVVVNSVPSTFAFNSPVDIIQASNPYDILEMDAPIAGISGTTITFASLPSELLPGDWIALAGEAPVALIPEELQPVLVQSALCSCLTSKKDKAAEIELQKLAQMKESVVSMLDPRVENNDHRVRPVGLLGHFRNR